MKARLLHRLRQEATNRFTLNGCDIEGWDILEENRVVRNWIETYDEAVTILLELERKWILNEINNKKK